MSEAGRRPRLRRRRHAARRRGDDVAGRPPHRAAQPHRQGAAGARCRHGRRRSGGTTTASADFIRAPYCGLPGRAPLRRRRRRRLRPARSPTSSAACFIRLKVGLPRRRRAVRAVLALPAVGVHHPGPQAQREALRASASSPSPRCCSPSARCWPTSRWRKGLELLLVPGRRRRGHRAHRAGLHRLRALACWSRSGVSFEVPLIAVALNLVGVLSYEVLRKSRRWIFFLTIVFAAFVTPDPGPVHDAR